MTVALPSRESPSADREGTTSTGPHHQRPGLGMGFLVSNGLRLSVYTGTSATFVSLPPFESVVADAVTGVGGYPVAGDERGPNMSDAPATTAEAVRQLHSRSGLSWEELARLFGVSRRSLHKWATGGTLNAANARRLSELTRVVNRAGDSPSEVRHRLLTPDPKGGTPYQQLIRDLGTDTERPEGLSVESLLGNTRVGDHNVLGPEAH